MRGRSLLNSEYFAYLQSPGWKQIRAQRLSLAGGRCEVCGTKKALDVHHLTYARIFKEKLGDLMVLCRDHHTEAESLVSTGILEREGRHLRASTLRALRPVRTTPNAIRDQLISDAGFITALKQSPNRKFFKKLMRRRFRGQKDCNRLMVNALILWRDRKDIR